MTLYITYIYDSTYYIYIFDSIYYIHIYDSIYDIYIHDSIHYIHTYVTHNIPQWLVQTANHLSQTFVEARDAKLRCNKFSDLAARPLIMNH